MERNQASFTENYTTARYLSRQFGSLDEGQHLSWDFDLTLIHKFKK